MPVAFVLTAKEAMTVLARNLDFSGMIENASILMSAPCLKFIAMEASVLTPLEVTNVPVQRLYYNIIVYNNTIVYYSNCN